MVSVRLISGDRKPAIKRAGFTLVELLVVISIIALLLAILMPSLSRAREQAKSVICLSNLRQIGIGLLLYVQNNNNTYMTHYGTSISQKAWHTRLLRNDKIYSDNQVEYINGYDVLFCPSMKLGIHMSKTDKRTWPDLKEYAAYQKGWISYGLSTGMTYDYGSLGYPEDPAKTTDIRQPAKTILVAEAWNIDPFAVAAENQLVGCFYLRPYYQSFGQGYLAIRHNASCNTLWVDGHVTRVGVTDPEPESAIYGKRALTNSGMSNNYWDRK